MPERKAILVRLPEELWEDLRRLADADLRSLNGEIEFILREEVRRRLRRRESDPESQAD